MERQIQYYIYGILIPYRNIKDNFEEYRHQEDVHGVFWGKDGKFIILGKVLDEDRCFGNKKPFVVAKMDKIDELIIQNQVRDNFNIEGKFEYFFVTK
jgi:hypothetical protein